MAEEEKEFGRKAEEGSDREEPSDGQEKESPKAPAGRGVEGIYDRLPDISVKAVDRFILLCVIGLVAVVVIGVLKARHVI